MTKPKSMYATGGLFIFLAFCTLLQNCIGLPTSTDAERGLQRERIDSVIDATAIRASNGEHLLRSTGSNINKDTSNSNATAWRLITRSQWQAREPNSVAKFTGPSPYVIVHHSYQPGVCLTEDACKAAMRSMQNFHMDGHGWPDIGYSFAVGGDGNVYEARGYNTVGAHAPNYNSRSIGLLLIGNFVDELPPPQMLFAAQDFIRHSVEIGELNENYILHGHRQVRETECPGDALYAEILNWPHWQGAADLTKRKTKKRS